MMKIINVTQGTPEWLLARAPYFCASEAAAMFGVSTHQKRAELMNEKAAGISKEFTPFQQALLVRGHEAESIRAHIESLIGDELFPVVGAEGKLLASFDGVTMDGETVFEHKLWNEELATQVEVGELGPAHYWQLEQQLHVSKAKRVIFVCSDGTPEKCVHMFYTPEPGRAAKLLLGWEQFDADLCAWTAPAPEPVVEKKALMALPALSVALVGKVTTSNLPAYRASALEFIKAINTDLQTDQDFSDAETTVKFCEGAEKNIQVVKEHAIAQTASIDELFRALDQISEAMRSKRLALEKLVKTRKDQIRADIAQASRKNWNDHITQLNTNLRRVTVTVPMPDFGAAIKGKRTLSSLREAVDSVLTAAKIEATQQSELFASRLTIIDEVAKDHEFLVRDLAALVAMPTETLSAVIKQRIADHKAEIARKATAAPVPKAAPAPAQSVEYKVTGVIGAGPAPAAPAGWGSVAGAPDPAPVRPPAAQIIDVVACAFDVDINTALGWFAQIDWRAALAEAA
jgi:predicted phage-related endonuclease